MRRQRVKKCLQHCLSPAALLSSVQWVSIDQNSNSEHYLHLSALEHEWSTEQVSSPAITMNHAIHRDQPWITKPKHNDASSPSAETACLDQSDTRSLRDMCRATIHCTALLLGVVLPISCRQRRVPDQQPVHASLHHTQLDNPSCGQANSVGAEKTQTKARKAMQLTQPAASSYC